MKLIMPQEMDEWADTTNHEQEMKSLREENAKLRAELKEPRYHIGPPLGVAVLDERLKTVSLS